MKLFKAFCHRSPEKIEIGPQEEFLLIKAPNKNIALKMSKQLAKERSWQFLEMIPIPED